MIEETTMPTIAENQAAHPEWYIDPAMLDADVLQYLAWQSEQPGTTGQTIGADWELAGAGPFYAANALRARQTLDRHAEGVLECQATGQTPPDAPWTRRVLGDQSTPHATGIAASEGGAVFGGV